MVEQKKFIPAMVPLKSSLGLPGGLPTRRISFSFMKGLLE